MAIIYEKHYKIVKFFEIFKKFKQVFLNVKKIQQQFNVNLMAILQCFLLTTKKYYINIRFSNYKIIK